MNSVCPVQNPAGTRPRPSSYPCHSRRRPATVLPQPVSLLTFATEAAGQILHGRFRKAVSEQHVRHTISLRFDLSYED